MPIILACPTCHGQLRVSDDLIGRKVRCPACHTTFDAAEPAPPPPAAPEAPVETVPLSPWQNLDLELASDPPESPPRVNPAITGAVEIDPGPEAPGTEPTGRREREEPRPRVREDDDMRPCPNCGKTIYRDARRCNSCGERFGERPRRSRRLDDDDDDDVDRRRRPVRRDCEPHRGGLILTFGILSVVTPILLFFCFPLAVIGLAFGIPAWWMGQTDRRKIRDGAMDPDGEGTTQAGWICGIIGVCLNFVMLLGCGGFFGYMYYDGIQQSNKIKRQPFAPPPPPRRR